ncbi:PIG-L deacetylase family protein [Neolewinella antarctica]|uniref:LmbE family N-acetylglucosaminyl deacetylase n=1 Tax=Neolewinella antarctica TaxID=442734 RepID=A0ABX0XFS0_9BACT|nr:PIG-L family deacetylase [Neolewinella antarctica]NJC28165.1 LmbE family N-acetylglucosaminyl deacetylase [Neolewinella antarctica]
MILALSPHLDDAVFSVGGYLHQQVLAPRQSTELAHAPRSRVQCVTVFTSSVLGPTGFALACQLDKGLAPEVDYMDLRRAEDRAACEHLGVGWEHLDFREAPHRGYDSAPALFTGIRATDDLDTDRLLTELRERIERLKPNEVLYPFGAGNHVDHLQLIAAVETLKPAFPGVRFRQYYDMPYARNFSERYPELGREVAGIELADDVFSRKVAACNQYTTQVAFQFGGQERIAEVLGQLEFLR